MPAIKSQQYKKVFLLLLAFISCLFMSPKWTFAMATWIYFLVLLRFYRTSNWKGFLLSIPVIAIASFIGQIEVIPMPVLPVFVMMFFFSTIGLIPFVIDRIVYKRLPDWVITLVFPTSYTLFAYLLDSGPQGTWGNSAYTQYSFLPLMQIASVTGIYGINFLICWSASFLNYAYEKYETKEQMHKLSFLMPVFLFFSIGFGMRQLSVQSDSKGSTRMATLTMDNLDVIKQMYESETGESIELPTEFSQSDPIVSELQKGIVGFMAKPGLDKFKPVYSKMDSILEKYISATRTAADAGAKIITWSEAAISNIKSREKIYEQKLSNLADELDIYLFFPTAVFHPEKVGKEELYIENKVLTFSPEGELLNTYFKNIPVMGVEPSFPGDGIIPVIETVYGNLSPIICYDADHPQLIAQIAQKATDLLVVPTGDWKAISPYHTYMAAVRCIENGVSMIKATSNGLSAMIDDKGRILASVDFFTDEDVKAIIYDMPVQSSETLYSKTHQVFIHLLKLFFILFVFLLIKDVLNKAKKKIE